MSEPTHKIKLGCHWVDVPNEARWVSMDDCGSWSFHETKPKPAAFWGDWTMPCYYYSWDVAKSAPPKDWTQELYKIEREA